MSVIIYIPITYELHEYPRSWPINMLEARNMGIKTNQRLAFLYRT